MSGSGTAGWLRNVTVVALAGGGARTGAVIEGGGIAVGVRGCIGVAAAMPKLLVTARPEV
jgi:hypothetical protein